jgi:transaldolase
MKIWLDTTNVDLVKRAARMGLLFGVTTNPGLIDKAERPLKKILQGLLDCQDGPVTAQVTSHDAESMVQEAMDFYDFSDRIIVKVPVTDEGYVAIHRLSEQEIPTMATVIFHPNHVFIAAKAGALYAAPYLGQMEKNGLDPWEALNSMKSIINNINLNIELLAASISNLDYFQYCAELGIPNITLKDSVFNELISTAPLTKERVEHFLSVAQKL